MKRKILVAVLTVFVLFAGLIGYALFRAFGGNKPVENGAVYNRAIVVEDMPFVAMFLLEIGGGKYVLVDGGADHKGEALWAALAAKEAKPEDVVAIVLTHGHSDHIGALYALPGVPLWVHEADVAAVEGRENASKNWLGPMMGANPPGLKVTNTFKGGDVLTFGELSIEVFHAPGHTSGNCALLVDGVLLLGDTAQVTKDERLRSPPPFFSDNPAQAIESIRKLGDTFEGRVPAPKWIVGAHSGPTQDVVALTSYEGD